MTDKKDLGVVLYTDGGCRAGYLQDLNSKCGGWGIHGYSYPIGVQPKQLKTKKDAPTVLGYQEGNKVKASEQVVPEEYIDAFGSMTKDDSSDRAELKGLKEALKIVEEKGYKSAHFLIDNQYVLNGIKGGIVNWEASNWKKKDGTPYANKEIWLDIMSTYQPLVKAVDFTFTWVNGHSGNLGNDRADYLATKGVYFNRNGELNYSKVVFSKPQKYRDPKPEINRLFAKTRWYFDTVNEEPTLSKDGRYVYHCGSHGADDTLVGKPMSDSSAVVIFTKEKQEILEKVRLRHKSLIPNPLNHLCVCRLDTLLLPRIYSEIEEDGLNVLSIAPRKLRYNGLCTIDEQELTRIIEPSGLTFKLTQVHNYLQAELEGYLEGKGFITEVTNEIYDIKEGKKGKVVCTSKIKPSDKKLIFQAEVDGLGKQKCVFTFGIDIPSKELIKAIQDRQPKVYITTWKQSEHAFKYGIIFDLEDDVMLWTGKDSSLSLVFKK